MEFWQIGSIRQYAKRVGSQTVWEMKKRSGDVNSHGKTLHSYTAQPKAASPLPQEDRDDRLTGIINKAQTGKKLSHADWEYLREKNPQLYQKLRQVEEEAENYEKALRRCKTRDEAQRLHTSKLGEIMVQAKNGDDGALFRLNRMERAMTEFTKGKTYRKLPTEAEEAAEREAAKAEDGEGENAETPGEENSLREGPAGESRTPDRKRAQKPDAPQNGQKTPVHTPDTAQFPLSETGTPGHSSGTGGYTAVHTVPYGREAYREQADITVSGEPRRRSVRRKA